MIYILIAALQFLFSILIVAFFYKKLSVLTKNNKIKITHERSTRAEQIKSIEKSLKNLAEDVSKILEIIASEIVK
jgi:hypothetical protein